ncbi:transcriptional regulator, LacI family [Sanguibacter gelidistatuariae]|uniref:Transcriptional regulator, LacI family n=1 Tax=Sanguibacter gelidistatuariae TaxID=1814289 RepID=A0A1G6XFR7_9MICO|nr:LacI family DNA-binding transcriptional regulator [Sanguibacter gelidistatuariae]SDD76902.1 transcriptional regulator, LacI family [Sanguibacter gelidistatuariae]
MAVARPKKVTIRDVAAHAGVSHMTVSRVLNGATTVTAEREQAVRRAIAETGFTASASARQLATGTAEAYAVVLTEPIDELLTDPTYASVLKGITDGLAATSVAPVLFTMATSQERAKGLRMFKRGTIDAVIHISPYVDDGMLDELQAAHIPVVLCGQLDGRRYEGIFSSVYSDDVLGSSLAAEHLLARGATRIAAIMGPADNPATPDRVEGLRRVLADRLLPHVSFVDWDTPAGYSAGVELATSGVSFDAVACGNDRIAVGVLQALREHKVRVPEDVLVIGFDDHPVAARSTPQLTTVHQHFRQQGEIAVSLAAEMVAGGPPRTVLLTPEVIKREST